MAAVIGNDEEQRVIDRIRANAYREAMEKVQRSSIESGSLKDCIVVRGGLRTTKKRDTNIVLRNLVTEDQRNCPKKVKAL
jgi:hypothetical protein